MAKVKSTKRALLVSALSILLSVSMLVGSTFAWFTDSVASGSNVIQSGNLDIEVLYSLDGQTWNDLNGATDLFQKGLWEPGHTEVVALKIENKGSLALKYAANMNIIDEVVGKNKEGGDIVLSEILTVNTMVMDGGAMGGARAGTIFSGEDAAIWKSSDVKTSTFKTGNVLASDNIVLAGEDAYVLMKVDMAEEVGNEANHNGVDVPSIKFGLTILATQYTYENDSFGNQYDADAEYPAYWDGSVDTAWYDSNATEYQLTTVSELAGLAKLVNTGVDSFAGKTVTLSEDIDLCDGAWAPIGTSAYPFKGAFDGNGKTVSNLMIETTANSTGLFGYVAAGTSIKNLTVNNVTIKDEIVDDTTNTGAVVGYCAGAAKLENVNVTGNISIEGEWYVGGLIGRSKGSTITNCSVVGEAGSSIGNGRWIAAIVGYDNGEMKVSGCNVENLEIKATCYAGGIAGLGAAGANVNNNSVKNVDIVLVDAVPAATLGYGTVIGGTAVYSYSAKPVYCSDNAVDGVTCTVNGVAAAENLIGSKYEDGTDQGLVMTATVKLGNGYYTYLKKAIEAAPKDGTECVIELTGDTMITAKFKPSVAKNQNIVLKTNGYKLIWVEQDANKVPVTDAEGNLVTVDVTAENVSSYITVKTGGNITIQ